MRSKKPHGTSRRLPIKHLRWMTIGAVTAILVGTFLFWKAELANERANLQAEASVTGSITAEHIAQELRASANSLEHMADRIGTGLETDRELWSKDARNFIKDNQSFQAIEWIDKDLRIRWVEPLQGNEKVVGIQVRFDEKRKAAVDEAALNGKTSISKSINLIQGGKGFLIYAPVFKNGQFQGMIAGVYRSSQFMKGIPKNVALTTGLEILEDGLPLLSNSTKVSAHSPSSVNPINFLNSTWMLRTTSGIQLPRLGSPLAILILCAGFVVAFTTAFALISLEKWMTIGYLQERARKFLEGMTEASVTPVYVFDFTTGKISYSNRFGYESLGLAESEILKGGLPLLKQLVHPEDWGKTLVQFAEVRKLKDGDIYSFEHRIRGYDGSWRWIAYRECVLERSSNGEVSKVLLTSLDITVRKESEQLLAQSKTDLEKVLEYAPIGMAIVGTDGRWIDVNPALCQIIGYTREELLLIDFQTITHPDDLESDMEKVGEMLAGEIHTYSMEKRYYHKDGRLVWALLCVSLVRYPNGDPRHFISQIQDISNRKLRDLLNQEFTESLVQQTDFLAETNTRLELENRTDMLTGLANRRYFGEQFSQQWHVAARYDRPLSTIMLDVDHFKNFNDEFGHAIGDQVLQHVAVVLREICREADLIARWGGEEFVVLCPETELSGAVDLAERLRQKIAEIDLPYRKVTASFGVASVGNDPATVFDRADAALYFAKASGRNCVKLEDPSPNASKLSA